MLQIDNRKIYVKNVNDLIKMDIILPEEQRIIDNQKINSIVNYQIDFYKKYNHFNFIGVINIHYCEENNNYYLVDGQHRYKSLHELWNNYGHSINIFIEIINVSTINELKHNFEILNLNTPLPVFTSLNEKNIVEKVAIEYQNLYPNVWSKTSRARRPHIYFNYFQESLGYICDKLKIDNSEILKDTIDDYNNTLTGWQFMAYKSITMDMYEKAKKEQIFFGLFPHNSNEDYGYEWAKRIVEIKSGIIIKKKNQKRKKTIPKKFKNDVWDKYIGKNIAEAYCICCNNTIIESRNFEAGHIISERNNGEININNIVPICSGCNRSMGTMNMNEYIKKYNPQNHNNFINKKYRVKQQSSNKTWFGF